MADPWNAWSGRLADVIPIGVAAIIVIVALVLLWGIWWVWWRLPQRQVAWLALKIRDPKARADVEDNFRKTTGQALGGAAVLIGAIVAYLQFSQQQQTSHDLLISNQVAKGFEQLGSDKVVVRLGGIYALQGVMNTSQQYYRPVLDALCAFAREGTIGMIVGREPATDIQAALTVIGRRAFGIGQVDLSGATLPGAKLDFMNLLGANLSRANLNGAHLENAALSFARLDVANLSGADLLGTNLYSADLKGADLSGADLSDAKLSLAILWDANLSDADLSGANLAGAGLIGANLNRANFSNADLSGTILGQQQLDAACGTNAKLPPGLTLKPCQVQ